MKKIWYCVCLLFCAYSMHRLIEERNSVGYVLSNRPESFRYLACYPTRNLTNRTELSLDELNQDMLQSFEQMKQQIKYNQKGFERLVLNVTVSKQYRIFNDHVCFTVDHYYHLWSFYSFGGPIRYIFEVTWKFFAFHSDDYEFRTYEIVPDHSTYVGLLIIYHKPHPYSKCRQGFSKYYCLNDCFKSGNRLSKYYYAANETGRIRLDYDNESRSIVEHEINCTRLCRWESCKINYFLPSFVYNQTTTVFVAKRVITTLDYYANLVGLLCLFTCSSLYQIAVKLLKFVILKAEKEKLKRFVRYVQLANPLVCALFCIALYTQMALIYRHNLNNPTRKETTATLFTPEIFHGLVCIRADEIFGRSYKYANQTFAEFEKDTDLFFNQTVSEIYVNFQGRKHSVDWQLLPKTIFKYNQRCFLVRVLSNQEPRSQSLLLASKLTFKIRHPIRLYLQTEAEISPGDPYFEKEYSFIKKIKKIIQDEKRCVNYKTKFNCRDRESCIGRCTNERIFKQLKHFVYGSIIDKDELSEEQWATTKAFVRLRDEEYNVYINASEECRLKYTLESCHKVVFERGVFRPQANNYTLELELYYEIISRFEEEPPSWYKLLLNALNIQTILFGLTVPKLFSMLLNFRKFNLGPKEKKLAIFGVYLLCTVGFSLQTFYIFHEVVSGEMTTSQFYEIAESLKMPELVFCLPIDEERIDKNHRLTANYLDKITGDLTPETMFDRILYLRASGEWSELNANFSDENFKTRVFFFFSKKCILLRSNVLYERTNMRFHFKNQKVLKILFNSELLYPNASAHHDKKLILFFTKTENSLQFSKMTYLKFENFKKFFHGAFKRVVRLSQESFFINFDDKFRNFKNPLSLFYESNFNDVNSYLLGLIENRFQIGTLSLPKVIDDIEIDEYLFEQYFRQVQNVTDHSIPINPNYQREFATNYQTRSLTGDLNAFDFEFQLIHFKKVITSTNDDSYAKLILSLLNVLSIWYDMGILALHWYIDKLIQLPFQAMYRLLLKIHEMLWLIIIKEKMTTLRENNPKEENGENEENEVE